MRRSVGTQAKLFWGGGCVASLLGVGVPDVCQQLGTMEMARSMNGYVSLSGSVWYNRKLPG